MRKLPETIPMRALLFGDGKNGYAMQVYINDEYHVSVISIREKRGDPFVETWTSERTGDQAFKSFAALRDAYYLLDGREHRESPAPRTAP